MPDTSITTEQIDALPDKMRAHQAAKALGTTSKELIAALAEKGLTIKSAQSSVTRDALRSLADVSPAGDDAAPKAEPETAAPEPEAETPAGEKEATSTRTLSIFTGDVGPEDEPKRRRKQRSPKFSPLFLSPEESDPEVPPAGAGQGSDDSAQESPKDSADADRSDDSSSDQGSSENEDTSAQKGGDDESKGGGSGRRRRRRGRRGRGRGRGDDNDSSQDDAQKKDGAADTSDGKDTKSDGAGSDDSGASGDSDTDARDSGDSDASVGSGDSGDSDDAQNQQGQKDGEGSSRRRRRRRRRRSGGGQGGDDQGGDAQGRRQKGTGEDEVKGISGSTRLEAKRQRRRDGREAGRKRKPILSEAEFLARRESVDRVMVVREKPRSDGGGIMTQVGVLEDNVLVEHFVTTETARSMVGNVYLGRVQNVLPSMEAAFVDIGRGRNGVLYAGEVNWEAAGLGGRQRKIEQALSPGDMVLVQVTKDPVGQKGARLTTQVSLAGRFLVYVPEGNSAGISRKLPDKERKRLKAILKEVVPEGAGVIIRTAAEGVSEEEIKRDVDRLASQWTDISERAEKRQKSGSGSPESLYEEPDLLVKVVRDLFNEDFSALVIQGEKSWDTVHDYVSRVAPAMVERLEKHENPDVDVFARHRIDEQLSKALSRKVWLPSGGSLVIDRTEAMTVIDVNTGKFTGSGGNLEETVTKNNLEAAEEIVRQLRLRDVGGMVIVDFIDMVLESNRDLVLRRLTEALGRDRTRHQVSEVTSLGLVQMTRKRLGTGLIEAFSTPCEHCSGRGLVIHDDPIHTDSHNDGESGGRKGRRKGRGGNGSGGNGSNGNGGNGGNGGEKKNAPAPAAHPAILAMQREDDESPESEETSTDGADTTPAAESDATAGSDDAERPTRKRSRRRRSRSGKSGGDAPKAAETSAKDEAPAEKADKADAPVEKAQAKPEKAEKSEAPTDKDEAPAETLEQAQAPAEPVVVTPEAAPAPQRRARRRAVTRSTGAPSEDGAPSTPVVEEPAVEITAAELPDVAVAVTPPQRERPKRRRVARG